MSYDARKKKIISEFIECNGPITGEYLSKVVGVSSRTIRNDIKLLNKELKTEEIEITSTPRIGYSVNPYNNNTFKVLKKYTEGTKDNIAILPEDRVFYIIKRLLDTSKFITLEQLSNELYVSKSTVDNDIDKVEKWVKKNNLELIKRPNYGIKIHGDEMQFRYSISDYFMSICDTKYIEDILNMNVDKIRNIILDMDEITSLKLSDVAFNNLIIHIAIAIKRIKEGKDISLPPTEITNLKGKKEYEMAEKIVNTLEKEFCISIPHGEKAYITIHLLGIKALKDEELNMEELEAVIGSNLLKIIYDMLTKLEEVYKINFSKDEKLIYGLVLHLKPAVNRVKYNMNLRNPLLNEIKEEYPRAFEMGVVASKVLEHNINLKINEDEIGYIAMHIGASLERKKDIGKKTIKKVAIICSTGIGTAQLLASKIRNTFPNIIITGIHPSYKIEEVLLKKPDLILSTIPIKVNNVPVIYVSSLLGKKDLQKIRDVIEDSEKVSEKIKLYDLFHKDLYIKGIKTKDKFEVIKILSKLLNDKNCVTEEFLQSVIEREQISSTSISNLVAIPHALFENVIDSKIAIGILEKPIQWGENMVQIVLLLALEKMTDEDFTNIFDTLFSILDDKKGVLELVKADCFENFMKLIKSKR
ncbi:BglG family transcription antiterminator [Clostridium sp. Marseille-Q2269]|uniref:BglG family transcription antiterminator n=1 Tax=Clostridium sp. Marseille-Q2269 TaxID=2942205 RepID=UPI00207356E6|nr:BglG family transcription antiterminator [Clostridium sp. Marseille-Q2269]